MKRRQFLKNAATASSAVLLPAVLQSNRAAAAVTGDPVTVVIFLRGAADPLAVFPMIQSKVTASEWSFFTGVRPNIRVPGELVLNSTAKFGLHPSLTAIHNLWKTNQAVMLMGAGSLNVTRSHFDQMGYIEGGNPVSLSPTGYLNRALAAINPADYILQGLAMQPAFDPLVPISLRGNKEVQAIETIEDLAQLSTPGIVNQITLDRRISGMFGNGAAGCSGLTNLTQRSLCVKAGASLSALSEAKAMVTRLNAGLKPSSLAAYKSPEVDAASGGSIGAALHEAARCIYSQPKVRFLTVDFGSFDTHNGQGAGPSNRGGLDWRLLELNAAIQAFYNDAVRMGFWSRTNIVIMSEFGRTIRQNATQGTDHGRGGLAMILGPSAKIGTSKFLVPAMNLQSLADPNRAIATRNEVSDPYNALPVAYDLRRILSELLIKRYGLTLAQIENVFPGYSASYSPLNLIV
jgi:uncharacterized protein (DUF1501 family)